MPPAAPVSVSDPILKISTSTKLQKLMLAGVGVYNHAHTILLFGLVQTYVNARAHTR